MPFSVLEVETGTTTPTMKDNIPYKIGVLPGDVSEEYNTTSGTKTFLCTVDFDLSTQWLWEMLGYSYTMGGTLFRVLPEKCGWDEKMYALSAKLVKIINNTDNAADGWPIFEKCVYQVTFGYPLYDVLEDEDIASGEEYKRFVVWSRKSTAENRKFPSGGFKFSDGTAVPDEFCVMSATYTDLQAKWLDVPQVDYAVLDDLMNRVNNASITLDGTSYDAEKVMFSGWDEVRRVTPFGDKTRDIIFTFSIKTDTSTWNKVLRKSGSGVAYDTPVDSLGNKMFQQAAILNCFTVA